MGVPNFNAQLMNGKQAVGVDYSIALTAKRELLLNFGGLTVSEIRIPRSTYVVCRSGRDDKHQIGLANGYLWNLQFVRAGTM